MLEFTCNIVLDKQTSWYAVLKLIFYSYDHNPKWAVLASVQVASERVQSGSSERVSYGVSIAQSETQHQTAPKTNLDGGHEKEP